MAILAHHAKYVAVTLLVLLLVSCAALAQPATPQVPAQLSFLPTLGEVRKNIDYESYGQFMFASDPNPKRGQHWTLLLNVKGPDDRHVTWNAMKPTFEKNGWKTVKEFPPGATTVTVSSNQSGEAWALIDMLPGGTVVKIDMVLVGPPPFSLTLAQPASTPEKVDATKGDFPYLTPLPGSRFHSGMQDPSPFWVLPKGATQKEMVAPGSITKSYDLPQLSNLLFINAYRDALTKAGWEIVEQFMGADASLTAHFSKNGRNIWANVHNNSGGYTITVADTGNDLGSALARDCHIALYGVLFDFNKSTLQPASDAVLQQVANLLNGDKSLKIEAQGHTDNVGGDAYNQKLSEDRARSVVAWLTAHGVAADRLSSKGYGKTMPVADNTTDQGRAKNRRVEIADPRCKAK